ncbi:hypothetical protein SLI_0203 [Streptomyces lividans 1326]|uniref:Uncharacterized protein n=1 Tax=Streptomyces lividans 1326 TaxID=1200984 RepID=A0A7U9DJ53_STRLI|nr:hypothetical protein SLI_0203 [Streptomyces lividans 1326]
MRPGPVAVGRLRHGLVAEADERGPGPRRGRGDRTASRPAGGDR